ncbi:MAG TPA: 50S ribosomal protein L1 [Candidatus Cryosericum sp.]|nr:50S ribosomal protein L1 [Candidatus Cryosericum sp.]
MNKKGKKYQEAAKLIDSSKAYTLDEAALLLPKLKTAKFDETIEVSMKLNVDPKQADQNVRGVVTLPAGTGKTVRVAVFTKGDKTTEAQEAGADVVGGDELIERIRGGWLEFDVAIATPDMMASLGKVARILGPRGLMPNPKAGTVTPEVGKAVHEFKAGKIEFRVDKAGVVHCPLGKSSFAPEAIKENFIALLEAIQRARPASVKGTYMGKTYLSLTMSPSIRVDASRL